MLRASIPFTASMESITLGVVHCSGDIQMAHIETAATLPADESEAQGEQRTSSLVKSIQVLRGARDRHTAAASDGGDNPDDSGADGA